MEHDISHISVYIICQIQIFDKVYHVGAVYSSRDV
jgi:hypothetical protein